MAQRAFIALGPEASGNRYMVRVLMHHGCIGSGEAQTPFDKGISDIEVPKDIWRKPSNIAFHRSFPHGGQTPPLDKIVKYLRRLQYEPFALIMHRNYMATMKSQLALDDGHVRAATEAIYNIQAAYKRIYIHVVTLKMNFIPVNHSDLVDVGYMKWVIGALGLIFRPGYEEFKNPYMDSVLASLK